MNTAAHDPKLAERIANFHAVMFSPALSTWCAAIEAGHMTTWPALTPAQVRGHPPHSTAMVKGHLLDQQRANVRSKASQARAQRYHFQGCRAPAHTIGPGAKPSPTPNAQAMPFVDDANTPSNKN
jgi:hypothetical protein